MNIKIVQLISILTKKAIRVQTEMTLRSYTLSQLKKLLAQVPELQLVESYDFWYDIDEPVKLSTQDSCDTLLVLRRV